MTAAVLENVGLLANASGGVKHLRSLILALAVSGRLVPQLPTVTQGAELTAQLAEHWRKRSPRRVVFAEVSEAEQRYELPSSWKWLRFGYLAETRLGKMLDAAKNKGELKPYLRNTNVQWGRFELIDLKELRLETSELEEYSVKAGDLLICEGGEPGRCAVWRHETREIFFQKALHRARPLCGISADYLKLCLQIDAETGVLDRLFTGATIKHLTGEKLERHVIPVPPPEEQHRIVAKVDELMALCDRLEARQQDAEAAHARLVQALLDSLTQARDADEFQACWQRVAGQIGLILTTDESVDAAKQAVLRLAFSGRLLGRDLGAAADSPNALPAGWREVQIADIAAVGTGTTPARTNPAYFDPPEFHWVTSGETSSDLIDSTAQKVSALALAETNLSLYPPGTLLVAMYGQGKTRGQVSELAINACTNQACAAIQLKDSSPVHRQYVKYFFEKSYDELRELAAGGAQPNLNLGKIKSTLIPLPALEEQHRIVAKVTELLALCDQLKARIAAARAKHAQLAEALVAQAVAP